jgi:hypothetical protein
MMRTGRDGYASCLTLEHAAAKAQLERAERQAVPR